LVLGGIVPLGRRLGIGRATAFRPDIRAGSSTSNDGELR
jgi:hypothetical protein